MSLALHKADKIIRVTDPRIDFDQESFQVVTDSAQQIVYQRYPAVNLSQSILKFQTYQSPSNAISSKMYIQCKFRVTITGNSNDGENIYSQGFDAPRAFPLHSICNNAKIEINGAANDVRPKDLVDSLIRFSQTQQELGVSMSGCPSMLDIYQQYSDQNLYGTGASPLGGVGESGSYPQNRGGFGTIQVINNTQNAAVIEFETIEPVLISPLVWGKNTQKSLYGVKSLNITYNLDNDLTRVWSRINRSTPNAESVAVEIVGIPELHLMTFTPKLIDDIKPVQIYPWSKIDTLNQSCGSINAGATQEFTFNAQSLSGVPSRIYLFAKKNNKTVYSTDTFAGIEKLSVFFDGTQGIFANASQHQLYEVSASNGLLSSYSDFVKYTGSVFCMDFSKDIPMLDYMAVGSSKNLQFAFTATLRNLSDALAEYMFYVCIVYDGTFTIDSLGASLFQQNIISADDVINSKKVQKIPYQVIDTFATGGSFLSKLGNVAKTAKKLGEKAIKTYEGLSEGKKELINDSVKGAIGLVSPRLEGIVETYGKDAYNKVKGLAGLGYTEDQIYAIMSGGMMKKKKPVGGMKLTKAELKKLA